MNDNFVVYLIASILSIFKFQPKSISSSRLFFGILHNNIKFNSKWKIVFPYRGHSLEASDRRRKFALGLSIIIVFLTAFLMYAYYNRWFSFAARVGPFRIIHYVAWAGTIYIAISVILFGVSNHHFHAISATRLAIHVFGNLVAIMLVSMHFAGQLGRPADFYPQLGTGLALYSIIVLLLSTGFILRFSFNPKLRPVTMRFVHVSMALAFYVIIVIHILHGLSII